MLRRWFLPFLILSLLLTASAGAQMVPINQSRSSDATAELYDETSGNSYGDSQYDEAFDFLPFDSSLYASAFEDQGYADAEATQYSTIGPDTLLVQCYVYGQAEIFEDQWSGYCFASSYFDFEFSLDSEHTWNLNGSADANGGGSADMYIFNEFGNIVWSDSWWGEGSLLLNYSGTLPAGTYTFATSVYVGFEGVFFPDYAAAEAGLDCVFTVSGSGPTAVGDSFAAERHLSAGPNPMSERTMISFAGAPQRPVQLDVFDVRGRLVKRLVEGTQSSGQVAWDGRDANGRRVPQGTYFLRMRSGDEVQQRKVAVVR